MTASAKNHVYNIFIIHSLIHSIESWIDKLSGCLSIYIHSSDKNREVQLVESRCRNANTFNTNIQSFNCLYRKNGVDMRTIVKMRRHNDFLCIEYLRVFIHLLMLRLAIPPIRQQQRHINIFTIDLRLIDLID